MAMLASRSAPLGGAAYNGSYQTASTYRMPTIVPATNQGVFTSPTESEFSETYDTPDAIRYVMDTATVE